MRFVFYFFFMGNLIFINSCKKTLNPSCCNVVTITTDTTANATIIPPKEVAISNTMGFFLNDWQARTFVLPSLSSQAKPSAAGAINVNVDYSATLTKIPKYIFGNNANIFMGQFITEPILMSSLQNLSPNIIRFPSGSLSDVYFWNAASGQKPADAPDSLLDDQGKASAAYYWYGNNQSSWTFSVDNYYKVLAQTGSTGIITINYGYARYGTGPHPDQAAAHMAADWVRFDKGRTKFWEIGNENYGNWEAGYRINTSNNKDGQAEILSGTQYGTHFKVFADSMKKAATEIGASIKIGAVFYESSSGYNATQNGWDSGFLPLAGNSADYFIAHNYYTPYQQNSDVPTILNTAITSSKTLMDFYKSSLQTYSITQKPLALTEWNINAEGSMQKVSNIAGLHAVMVLGELLKNQYGEASRWDLANGWNNGDDHGLFNIGDEPNAPKWNARPAFYYLYYFQKMMGDRFISSTVDNNSSLLSYASGFSSGQAGIALVNTVGIDQTAKINISNFKAGSQYYYYTLSGGSDSPTFSRLVKVNGITSNTVSGGPSNYNNLSAYSSDIAGGIYVKVPAYGAVFLVVNNN